MDEATLAQELGEAFRLYAYVVAQGNIGPWRGFFTSNTVDVHVTFNGNTLKFVPIAQAAPIEAIGTTDTPEEITTTISTSDEPAEFKPKRRRKTT